MERADPGTTTAQLKGCTTIRLFVRANGTILQICDLLPHICYSSYISTSTDYKVIMQSRSPSWFVLSSKATADIRHEALIPAVVFTALAVFMVILRWYSRLYFTSGSIRTEDYLVTAALVSVT